MKLTLLTMGTLGDLRPFLALSSASLASVDHELLFPRCSCVVHHGGAGTTHTALESGTPAVICSTYADQPFWGERLVQMNIGRHIPFPKLTKRNLTQAIVDLRSESVRKRSADVGARVKEEIGLQKALEFIETHLHSTPVFRIEAWQPNIWAT